MIEHDAELIEARLRERAHELRRHLGHRRATPAPTQLVNAGASLAAGAPEDRVRCNECGAPIAAQRVAAVPGARRCMGCQRSFERAS